MKKIFIGFFLFLFFSFPAAVFVKTMVEKEEFAECQKWQQQLVKPHIIADWQIAQCENYGIELRKKGGRLL